MIPVQWWLVWWLFWATNVPHDEGVFAARQVWFFRDAVCEPRQTAVPGRWFEIRASGIENDSLKTLLIERSGPAGIPLGRRLIPRVFKLYLADIDGNGTDDLIAGVERTIRGRTWKRVYVYQARRPDFPPLWLGSRLSYVLDDFCVTHIRGRPGLHATEKHFGRSVSSAYLWYHFGFRTVSSREDQ
ncbi:MAG TPA: hypothetical protein PKM25_02420 [Candidatus Ozemobacteraceae bacterium]|nr:hypothetical protein [Candidatus Ozemobacteraceae bacterium]